MNKRLIIPLFYFFLNNVFGQKPELIIPSGQNSWITAIKITYNGKYMVSAAMDRSIIIYDLSQKRQVFTFWEHDQYASAIDIAPDNRTVVSGDIEGRIIVWDLNTGKVIHRCQVEYSNKITDLTIAPNGKTFLTADNFGYIAEFNLISGSLIIEERYHNFPINKIRYINKGSEFFASSPDISEKDTLPDISRTRVSNKKLLDYIYVNSAQFCSAVFSKDGSKLFNVVINPDEIRITNLNDKIPIPDYTKIVKIPIQIYKPFDIEILDDKNLLICSRKDDKVSFLVFDIINLKIKKVINTDVYLSDYFSIENFKMQLVPNSSQVIFITGGDAQINIFDYETAETYDFLPKKTNFQTPALLNNNLILAGEDKKLKKWNLLNNTITTLYDSKNFLQKIIPAKKQFLLKEGRNVLSIWDKEFKKIQDSFSIGNSFYVDVNQDSTKFLISGFNNKIEIYDLLKSDKKVLSIVGSDEINYGCVKWYNQNTIVYPSIINNKRCFVFLDMQMIEKIVTITFEDEYINKLSVNTNNNILISAYFGKIVLFNQKGELIKERKLGKGFCHFLKYEPKLKQIIASFEDGEIFFLNPETLEIEKKLIGHKGWTTEFTFSEDYSKLFTTGYDNTIKIWDYKNGSLLSTLSLLDSKEWVVVNENGLFDASPQAMKDIYYVVNNPDDIDEPWKIIELSQLKHRYFQPNLLQIQLGYNKEKLRTPIVINEIPLAPKITVSIDENKLNISLKNQKGGIGKVVLFIENAEVNADLRPNGKVDQDARELSVSIDLDKYKNRFTATKDVKIKVIAWNKEDWLSSRPEIINYAPIKSKGSIANSITKNSIVEVPRLFGLIVGTSDYTGEQIDLTFASKDAVDFANALSVSSQNLFGIKNSIINILSSDNNDINSKPTRNNIIKKLKELQTKIKPTDILVVYLSGHGVNFGGADGDFYYLTQEASGADATYLNDVGIRNSSAISSMELTQLLNTITAKKKILILDACASGKAAEKMTASKDVPASQIRALDRMQDRTGFYILAGSAADAVSYESSIYGQGLLTYSLLKAIKGSALRIDGNEEYIDIQTLFQFAVDEVPNLSKNIGGIQKPFYKSPNNMQSFDIGKVDFNTKKNIIISEPKPVFIEAVFSDSESLYDEIGLSDIFNSNLQENATKGKSADIAFMRVKEYPGAYKITGTYTSNKEIINLKYRIISDKKTIGDIENVIITKSDNNNEAVKKIIQSINEKMQSKKNF